MKPNILFILLDGSRWDRLHTSPEFMELQKKGTLLNNVITAIPYTFGSMNVIFTGLYGKENGVDAYYKMFKLKDSVDFLPELLQKNGYYTCCNLITDKVISKRGFDVHKSHDEFNDDLTKNHPEFIQQAFESAKEKPVFCFLQFSRIHTITVSEILKKYEWNDKQFYENKKENLLNYDKVFKEAGNYAELIKNEIDKLNLKNDSIVIFFSDHGTGVGERFGERNYGSFTFEETIRSFFLFLGNKIIKNKQSNSLRESIDVFPTILELIGIKKEELPGKSFAKFLTKEGHILENKSKVFSETGAVQGPYPSPREPNVFCVKNTDFKLIFNKSINQWQMYDLKKDPEEKENIFGSNSKIEEELQQQLISWIEQE